MLCAITSIEFKSQKLPRQKTYFHKKHIMANTPRQMCREGAVLFMQHYGETWNLSIGIESVDSKESGKSYVIVANRDTENIMTRVVSMFADIQQEHTRLKIYRTHMEYADRIPMGRIFLKDIL